MPIGIIHSSWGGTPAEAWTSRGTLEAHAELRREFVDRITQLRAGYAGAVDTFNKETEVLKKQGKKQTAPPPKVPAMPTWQGAELHNGMIAPLVPFALKGAIWYQGEANASRAAQYKVLFAEMIKGWRREWELGDFPFLAVQLAPYDHARKRTIEEITAAPGDSDWARLRESQLHVALATPKTALAVITDAGDKDDIHPKLKEPAGARLALAARAVAYGEQVAWSGPVFKSMTVEGARAIVSFEHVGKGLEARGGKLTGFALCGDDRKFVWAGAEILPDNRVVVSHTDVKKPVAVRYGWADFPVVNLWNKEGLPASPFRTDTFSVAAPPTASKTPAKK